MTDPKLEIIPKKYSGESTVISLRITKAMLADIDKIAAATWRYPPTRPSEPANTAAVR